MSARTHSPPQTLSRRPLSNLTRMAIETPAELRTHLQWAIEVELSTIPPYLYALYAIEDQTSEAYGLIRSVAVEEMLHVALAANLLSAVGGSPRIADSRSVPTYPTPLPHHSPTLQLNLAEPTTTLIEDVFLTIEQPASPDSAPESDEFETLGQFYWAIEDALERLDQEFPLFEQERDSVASAANAAYQLANPHYYQPVEYDSPKSGRLLAINDLDSAEEAVETIIHQGEGLRDHRYADPEHKELTHYYKFKLIADGEIPLGTTRPVLSNPTAADLSPDLRPVAELFNASYSYTLHVLEELFATSDQDQTDTRVDDLYTLMTGIMPPLARFLTAHPARPDTDRHAGPPFRFYQFDSAASPSSALRTLADEVVNTHPDLAAVRDAVTGIEG